ncbi:hypothetical protein N9B94_00965 [Verrucomicrobia bacterium]|nr:hypothetical protein [Verrucomicrobiota bacterium]
MDQHPVTNFKMHPIALAVVIGVLFVFAIGGLVFYLASQDLDEGNVDMMDETVTYMGEHRLAIRPGSTDATASQSGGGTNTTYKFVSRTTTVILAPGRELIVNGFSFGNLKRSEKILVDEGKIFVENRLRIGVPIFEINGGDTPPAKENDYLDTRLNGHSIRIIPRPNLITRVGGISSQAIRADDFTITIRDSELIVDGVHHGRLKKTDAIVITPEGVEITGGIESLEE